MIVFLLFFLILFPMACCCDRVDKNIQIKISIHILIGIEHNHNTEFHSNYDCDDDSGVALANSRLFGMASHLSRFVKHFTK